jgi:hypothetical protein
VKRVSRVCVLSAARLNSVSHRRRRLRDEDTSVETQLGDPGYITRLFDFVNPNAVLRALSTLTTRS